MVTFRDRNPALHEWFLIAAALANGGKLVSTTRIRFTAPPSLEVVAARPFSIPEISKPTMP